MHADLHARRRVLILAYRRYLEADRAWARAIAEMKLWFPPDSRPGGLAMGDPGSPIRRLYERRDRALLVMETARLKLEVARQRLEARQETAQPRRLLLVARFES